jgi:hypothetical protein
MASPIRDIVSQAHPAKSSTLEPPMAWLRTLLHICG